MRARLSRFGRGKLLLSLLCLAMALPASEARPKARVKPHDENRPAPAVGSTSPPAASPGSGVRFWSSPDSTRIAVEVTSEFEFRSDRLSNPDRIFFDIGGVRPNRNPKGQETIAVNDQLVKQIRIAESKDGATRVVLDLCARADATASQLSNPDRLIIEVRPWDKRLMPPASPSPDLSASEPEPSAAKNSDPAAGKPTKTFQPPPPAKAVPVVSAAKLSPPNIVLPAQSLSSPALDRAARATASQPAGPPPSNAAVAPDSSNSAKAMDMPRGTPPDLPRTTPKADPAATAANSRDAMPASVAKRNSTGEQSMTRVLGLKLRRVVLDPGHGGLDGGTRGPSGLLENTTASSP